MILNNNAAHQLSLGRASGHRPLALSATVQTGSMLSSTAAVCWV